MTGLAEFIPLRAESIDSIRQRVDAGVNAGLDPANPLWMDTTPGGFFYDHTQVMALEGELLWDFASTELPASVFLPFSWGIYLDYWGELLDLPRKDEAQAVGEVTFSNSTGAAIVVGSGAEVAASSSDPDADPFVFTTTAAVTVPSGGNIIAPVQAEEPGSQYNVAVGAVTLMLSTFAGITVTNATAMSNGADVEPDETYKTRLLLEFSASRGGGTVDDYTAVALARPNVGTVVVQPRWDGAGTVRLVLTDRTRNGLSPSALAVEQDYWDPGIAGDGLGAAPINHTVTVATVTPLVTAFTIRVKLLDGYTVTAEAGKADIEQDVVDAATTYVEALNAGETIRWHQILVRVLALAGVDEVGAITVAGVDNTDGTVGPLQVAEVGTLAVVEI